MIQTIMDFLDKYIAPELVAFIISILPILELRGGLIAASLLQIPWYKAAVICIVGNLLPIPFILAFIKRILKWMKKMKPFQKIVKKFENKAAEKGTQLLKKHPNRVLFGLFIFVAIPLPGTGAWTGALVAALLSLKTKSAFFAICLGVLTAACIMLVLTYFVPSLFGFSF